MTNIREKLEGLYREMLKDNQDKAVVLMDTDGIILTWNEGAERIKGYKAEEIVGQNFRFFYTVQDRKEGLPEKLIQLAKKEGSARHIGIRLRKDGTTFWGSISLTALRDANNEVVGFVKLTRELLGNDMGY